MSKIKKSVILSEKILAYTLFGIGIMQIKYFTKPNTLFSNLKKHLIQAV